MDKRINRIKSTKSIFQKLKESTAVSSPRYPNKRLVPGQSTAPTAQTLDRTPVEATRDSGARAFEIGYGKTNKNPNVNPIPDASRVGFGDTTDVLAKAAEGDKETIERELSKQPKASFIPKSGTELRQQIRDVTRGIGQTAKGLGKFAAYYSLANRDQFNIDQKAMRASNRLKYGSASASIISKRSEARLGPSVSAYLARSGEGLGTVQVFNPTTGKLETQKQQETLVGDNARSLRTMLQQSHDVGPYGRDAASDRGNAVTNLLFGKGQSSSEGETNTASSSRGDPDRGPDYSIFGRGYYGRKDAKSWQKLAREQPGVGTAFPETKAGIDPFTTSKTQADLIQYGAIETATHRSAEISNAKSRLAAIRKFLPGKEGADLFDAERINYHKTRRDYLANLKFNSMTNPAVRFIQAARGEQRNRKLRNFDAGEKDRQNVLNIATSAAARVGSSAARARVVPGRGYVITPTSR